jgi:hypothetical protein
VKRSTGTAIESLYDLLLLWAMEAVWMQPRPMAARTTNDENFGKASDCIGSKQKVVGQLKEVSRVFDTQRERCSEGVFKFSSA